MTSAAWNIRALASLPVAAVDERVVLIGAGALARDIVEVAGVAAFCGVYVDPRFESPGLPGLPVFRDWAAVRTVATHYALGFLDTAQRPAAHAAAAAAGLLPASPMVSARAVVSPLASLAPGCLVGHHAVIGACVRLHHDTLVMHNAVIGHDCEIGDNTVVLPGAWIGGYVSVGCGGFIGANSVISPRLRLGRNVMLAPGAACLRDVPDDILVIGNPGRFTSRPTA
ncbi:hypothetical protein [Azohydromonas australica]|uniref:hypothetical protein n=1 Tax=Azohydromonas australica TaxID=364039 RepID=UPI0012EC740F|nr:hypothetical protein [Azohydromonas australica]